MSPEQEERLLRALESIADSLKASGPLSPAERAKRYREKRHGKSDDLTVTKAVTRHENSDGSGESQRHVSRDALGGGGGRSRSPSPLEDGDFSSFTKEESSHESRDVTLATVTPFVTPAGNATTDGGWGMAVDAWADGIRSVTGTSYLAPRGRPALRLVEALKVSSASGEDPCTSAFAMGAAYAKANVNRTLSPFHFADWVGSGRPSGVRRAHEPQPPPVTGKSPWEMTAEEKDKAAQ